MTIDPAAVIGIRAIPTRLMQSLDRGHVSSFGDRRADDMDFAVTPGDGRTIRAQGKAAVIRLSGMEGLKGPGTLRHVMSPVEIQVIDGNRASTFTYCTNRSVEADSFAVIGDYHDQLVREDDGMWRVSKRRHRFLTDLAVKVGS